MLANDVAGKLEQQGEKRDNHDDHNSPCQRVSLSLGAAPRPKAKRCDLRARAQVVTVERTCAKLKRLAIVVKGVFQDG